jgi:hypothetical protein
MLINCQVEKRYSKSICFFGDVVLDYGCRTARERRDKYEAAYLPGTDQVQSGAEDVSLN